MLAPLNAWLSPHWPSIKGYKPFRSLKPSKAHIKGGVTYEQEEKKM